MSTHLQRSLTPRLVLGGVSLLVAFGLGEVLARVAAPESLNLRFQTAVERAEARGHHELVNEILENDPVRFWRLKPNVTMPDSNEFFPGIVSNAQGLREDHEVPLAKPDGEIRILFVGDSCTFGWGVRQEKSLVGYVEESLRSRFPGRRIECINAGVPAYSLFQGWLVLENGGYDYQPDLVVLNFGTNDQVRWSGQSDLEHYEAQRAALPPAALRWSRLCGLLWRTIAARSAPAEADAPPRGRVPPEDFEVLLDRVRDEARKRDFDLLLIVWPYDWNLEPPLERRTELQSLLYDYGTRKLNFGSDRGPGYVDLVPVARSLGESLPSTAIFKDPLHTTATANRRFADAVAGRIVPWLEERLSR